jgi:hypothetical protein
MMDPRLQQLQRLRDLQLPPEPSWWPPATGWWLAALLLIAAVAWGARLVYLKVVRQRPYLRARYELDRLRHALEQRTIDERQFVDDANALVKRLCIHIRGESDVARLSDADWLAYLDRIAGSALFSQGPGAILGATRFAPRFDVDPGQVHAALEVLLRRLEANA